MTKKIGISIADDVFEDIEVSRGKTSRSEFIEHMIRKGLAIYHSEKREAKDNGTEEQIHN